MNIIFVDVMNDSEYNFSWKKLLNITADGPNINKTLWRDMNSTLKSRG